jgi:hypothetical protein
MVKRRRSKNCDSEIESGNEAEIMRTYDRFAGCGVGVDSELARLTLRDISND